VTAEFIFEVADTSLAKDREVKKYIYAGSRIREYWILNLNHDCLEVYTGPPGGDYENRATFPHGTTVSPSGFPDASVRVTDLLP